MENSSNIGPFDFQSSKPFSLLFHLLSELKMCFGLYLQVIVVIGSSVNQGSGHPEILDHRVGSVANLSEILTGNSFRGPGNNRKSRGLQKETIVLPKAALPSTLFHELSLQLPTAHPLLPLPFSSRSSSSWIRLGSFPLQSFPPFLPCGMLFSCC